MRKFFLAIAMLAAAALAVFDASAADMRLPSKQRAEQQYAPTWFGPYIGVNAGYGFNQESTHITGTDAGGGIAVASGLVPGAFKTEPDGWLGGVTLGYNAGFGAMVVGLEADLQFADIKGSASQNLTTAPFGFPASLNTTSEATLDWFGTVRARLGFTPWGHTLIYATGGGAYGRVGSATSATLTFPGGGAQAANAIEDTKFGWTVGGGFEHRFAPGWTLKAEYLYLDFGSIDGTMGTTVGGTPINFATKADANFHVLRAGLNWHFYAQ